MYDVAHSCCLVGLLQSAYLAHVSWIWPVCCADPARPLTTADEELDDLDDDLSDLSH